MDSRRQQYSHPAVVAIATPDGKISRYLYYGEKMSEETFRLSLVEASQNKIGSAADHWILRCFVFDGKQGKYALSAMHLMRLGGVLTVLIMAVFLVHQFRRIRAETCCNFLWCGRLACYFRD